MSSSPISTFSSLGVGGNGTASSISDSEKDCSVISETNKTGEGQNNIFPQFQQSQSKENDQPLQLPQAMQVGLVDSDNNSEKGQDLSGTIMTSAAEAMLTNSQ